MTYEVLMEHGRLLLDEAASLRVQATLGSAEQWEAIRCIEAAGHNLRSAAVWLARHEARPEKR